MRVQLGNAAGKEGYKLPGSDEVLYRDLEENRITYVEIPDSYSLSEAFRCVTDPNGVWAAHAQRDESGQLIPPLWVASTSPGLEMLIAEHFGGIDVGIPDDVEETHHTNAGPPGVGVSEPLPVEGDPYDDPVAPIASVLAETHDDEGDVE